MNYYSTQITNLIEELRRLPGIGSKSAQRLAFHIINMPEEHVHHLAQTLVTAREKIRYCKYCCTLTDSEVCPICASTKRDHSTIMVVEHTQDLAAYEKTGQYHGVYHVLQGTLAPSLGKGPDDIRFKELEERLNMQYMEAAQNPDMDKYRIPQGTAKQLLLYDDAPVYRLQPSGSEKIAPIVAISTGLWYENYREFAIAPEDLGALDKLIRRETDRLTGNLPQLHKNEERRPAPER